MQLTVLCRKKLYKKGTINSRQTGINLNDSNQRGELSLGVKQSVLLYQLLELNVAIYCLVLQTKPD